MSLGGGVRRQIYCHMCNHKWHKYHFMRWKLLKMHIKQTISASLFEWGVDFQEYEVIFTFWCSKFRTIKTSHYNWDIWGTASWHDLNTVWVDTAVASLVLVVYSWVGLWLYTWEPPSPHFTVVTRVVRVISSTHVIDEWSHVAPGPPADRHGGIPINNAGPPSGPCPPSPLHWQWKTLLSTKLP